MDLGQVSNALQKSPWRTALTWTELLLLLLLLLRENLHKSLS
jgi:hypothetical protein